MSHWPTLRAIRSNWALFHEPRPVGSLAPLTRSASIDVHSIEILGFIGTLNIVPRSRNTDVFPIFLQMLGCSRNTKKRKRGRLVAEQDISVGEGARPVSRRFSV